MLGRCGFCDRNVASVSALSDVQRRSAVRRTAFRPFTGPREIWHEWTGQPFGSGQCDPSALQGLAGCWPNVSWQVRTKTGTTLGIRASHCWRWWEEVYQMAVRFQFRLFALHFCSRLVHRGVCPWMYRTLGLLVCWWLRQDQSRPCGHGVRVS